VIKFRNSQVIMYSILYGLLSNGCGSSGSSTHEAKNDTNDTKVESEFITVFDDNFEHYDKTLWQKADWANGDPFYNAWCKEQIKFNDSLLSITLEAKECHGKTHASGEYRTHKRYKYGKYTARFKASDLNGTISSFFTYTGSSEGTEWDEIDIEILGKNPNKLQVNYWRNGHEHPKWIDLGFDASLKMHTYSFIWHQDYIKWYVDDRLIYTAMENKLNDNDSLPINAGKIIINLWAGTGIDDWSGRYDNTTATAQYDYVKYESYK